jgi:hypothetical protein
MPNTPQPFTGYKPGFEMPIVAPPAGADQATALAYYQQLQIEIGLALSGPNGEFVDITLAKAANATNTNSVDATLFAITGGFARYYPGNMAVPSPDNFTAPADGVLVLTVWIEDIAAQQQAFPPDIPAIGRIYYVGVDLAETTTLLRGETARMSDAALRASWKAQLSASPPSGTTHDQLVDKHNGFVMAGAASVFVDAGTPIGKIAQDTTAAVETFTFTLRMTSSDAPIAYVSPLPTFKGAPYYDLQGGAAA